MAEHIVDLLTDRSVRGYMRALRSSTNCCRPYGGRCKRCWRRDEVKILVVGEDRPGFISNLDETP